MHELLSLDQRVRRGGGAGAGAAHQVVGRVRHAVGDELAQDLEGGSQRGGPLYVSMP